MVTKSFKEKSTTTPTHIHICESVRVYTLKEKKIQNKMHKHIMMCYMCTILFPYNGNNNINNKNNQEKEMKINTIYDNIFIHTRSH